MGLDQYAHAIHPATQRKAEIAYWRKHNALQGWMEKLWIEKGRPGAHEEAPEEFNCVPVLLTSEDLDRLEQDVKADKLPGTSGFFFGESSELDEAKKHNTLDFIDEARLCILEGKEIYYNSWW